jgi:hypothetical protein
VDFSKYHEITDVKRCACYGADGELLWVVSSRPQAAWDNVLGGERYPDADLFGETKWEGKLHAAFEAKYRRGLQWLDPWQSKPTQRFTVKFYNCAEDNLLPGKRNGGGRLRSFDGVVGRCLAAFQQPTEGSRGCTGPDWEYQGIYVAMRPEPQRRGEVYAPGWDDGPIPRRSTSSGVEPGEVGNDTRDLMARWVPPASYFNDNMNNPFFE